jgi:hypothetical protein
VVGKVEIGLIFVAMLTSGPDIARRGKSLEIPLFRFKLLATEILEILERRAGPGGAGQADQ